MNREDKDEDADLQSARASASLADMERRVWEGDLAEDDEEYVKALEAAKERRARRYVLEAEDKAAQERNTPRSWKQDGPAARIHDGREKRLEIRCKQLEERLSWQKARAVAARLVERVACDERDRCEALLDAGELLIDELQEKIARLEDELRRVRTSEGDV